MKNLLINIFVIFLGMNLVACSTNTQGQNTGVGAVTGAVLGGAAGSLFGAGTGKAVAVGVGAVAGALVGGSVGHNMQHSDNQRVYRAMDRTPTNKTRTWHNRKTKTTYTVKPTSGMLNIKGNPNCRKFTTMGTQNGKTEELSGVACRQSDGTWKTLT